MSCLSSQFIMFFPLELLGLLVCVALIYKMGTLNPITSIYLRNPEFNPRDPITKIFKAGHCSLLKVSDFRVRKFLPAFPVFTGAELFFVILSTVVIYSLFLSICWTVKLHVEYLSFVIVTLIGSCVLMLRQPLSAALQDPMRSRPAMTTLLVSVILSTGLSIAIFAATAPRTILAGSLSIPFDELLTTHSDVMVRTLAALEPQVSIKWLPMVSAQSLRLLGGLLVVVTAVAVARSSKFEATMLEIVNGAPRTLGCDRKNFASLVRSVLPSTSQRAFSLAALFLALASYIPIVASFMADLYVPYGAGPDAFVRATPVIRSGLFVFFGLTRLAAVPGLVQAFLLRSATPYADSAEAAAFLQGDAEVGVVEGKQFPLSGKPELIKQAELAQRSVLLRAVDMATGPAVVTTLGMAALLLGLFAPGGAVGPAALFSPLRAGDRAFPFARAPQVVWGAHWASDALEQLAELPQEQLAALPSVSLLRDRPFGLWVRGLDFNPPRVALGSDNIVGVIKQAAHNSATSQLASDVFSVIAPPSVLHAWLHAVLLGIGIVYLAALAFQHILARANLDQGQTLGSTGSSSFSQGIESSGGLNMAEGNNGQLLLSSTKGNLRKRTTHNTSG